MNTTVLKCANCETHFQGYCDPTVSPLCELCYMIETSNMEEVWC